MLGLGVHFDAMSSFTKSPFPAHTSRTASGGGCRVPGGAGRRGAERGARCPVLRPAAPAPPLRALPPLVPPTPRSPGDRAAEGQSRAPAGHRPSRLSRERCPARRARGLQLPEGPGGALPQPMGRGSAAVGGAHRGQSAAGSCGGGSGARFSGGGSSVAAAAGRPGLR